MPSRSFASRILPLLLGVVVPAVALAQEPSGKAVSVIPDAEALRTAAQVRILLPDQPVFMGDRVKTGPVGEAQLLFSDETRLVVGPMSTLLVERYLLKGDNTVSNFTVNALRGSFRFITGESPKNAYAIRTPTATIGVRGTRFDLAIGQNGETHLVLFDGSADVCSGGSCVRASDSCSMVQVSPGGRPQAVQDVAQRTQTLRELFPYVAERANVLRSDFQVDSKACGLFSQPPLDPTQPLVPAAITVTPPPPPPPVIAAPAPPPPAPPPPVIPPKEPKPPKEHKPREEHAHHHHHKHDRFDRREGREGRRERAEASERRAAIDARAALADRRGGRERDRDRDRSSDRDRDRTRDRDLRGTDRPERAAFGRPAGGGIDWTAPTGPRRDEFEGPRDRSARDRDGRDRDGRDREGRGREGRDRDGRSRDAALRDGIAARGEAFSRHPGGGVDWSTPHHASPDAARGRDGGRGGRDADRADGRGDTRGDNRPGDRAGGPGAGPGWGGSDHGGRGGPDSRGDASRGDSSRGDANRGDGGRGDAGRTDGGRGTQGGGPSGAGPAGDTAARGQDGGRDAGRDGGRDSRGADTGRGGDRDGGRTADRGGDRGGRGERGGERGGDRGDRDGGRADRDSEGRHGESHGGAH